MRCAVGMTKSDGASIEDALLLLRGMVKSARIRAAQEIAGSPENAYHAGQADGVEAAIEMIEEIF